MRRRLCGKLHGGLSRLLFAEPACHRSIASYIADDRDLCLPHLYSTPPLGGIPVGIFNCHDVWCGKIRMVRLPDDEKNIEDMFIRFDRIHERDRRTDGQKPHDGIGRAYA